MTAQAQSAYVLKIALASTLDNWKNMIGIPKALSGYSPKSPVFQEKDTFCAAGKAQPPGLHN